MGPRRRGRRHSQRPLGHSRALPNWMQHGEYDTLSAAPGSRFAAGDVLLNPENEQAACWGLSNHEAQVVRNLY